MTLELWRLAFIVILLPLTACKLVIVPGNNGEVVAESGSYDCSESSCDFTADNGLVDHFSAIPNNGYRFVRWEGFSCGTDPVCTVRVPSVEEIDALFGDGASMLLAQEIVLTAHFQTAAFFDLIAGDYTVDTEESLKFTAFDPSLGYNSDGYPAFPSYSTVSFSIDAQGMLTWALLPSPYFLMGEDAIFLRTQIQSDGGFSGTAHQEFNELVATDVTITGTAYEKTGVFGEITISIPNLEPITSGFRATTDSTIE